MNFADQVIEIIQKKKSPICLGLDPHYDLIPDFLKKDSNTEQVITNFLKKILKSCKKHIGICKPNYAFFEEFGWKGIRALEDVCAYAKELDYIVIVDGKRNDIGSTASASARAFLSRDIYDGLTVNPYLGQDGILPFIEQCKKHHKGIFVLVKTSNLSSGEFQDLYTEEMLLHEHVAAAVARWGGFDLGENGFSSVGAVVGATYPEEIKSLRNQMPSQLLLIPGYGTQGGNAEDIYPAFYNNGNGAIVNSSRGILFASREQDFEEAAFKASLKAKNDFKKFYHN